MNFAIKVFQAGVDEKGVYLNSGIPIFQNALLGLELSKILRPAWLLDNDAVLIFFPVVYKNILEGDILAYFTNGKEKFPAIIKKGDKIIFNFDPRETIDFIQNERYLVSNKLFYRFLPVQYHLVPGAIRRYIKKLSIFIERKIARKDRFRFPSWPFDASVETIRYILFGCRRLLGEGDLQPFPSWPERKKSVVILSHDIDTEGGFGNIDKFLKIEKKYDFHSSWFVVGRLFSRNKQRLAELAQGPNEIGCHGYLHDNKLTSFSKEKMRDSLLKCSDMIRELDIKGFRSPSLLRSRQLFEALEEFFLYDSSVPDTEAFLQIAPRSGCCTVFPYTISNNLLELPITLPLDSTLMALGFKPDQIFEIWKAKIEWIRKIGGIAHTVTHAESYYSGNKGMLGAYERLLSFISEDTDSWMASPGELALWWRNG